MALISSSAALPALGYSVMEKLAKNNYSLWKAQVTSALRGAQMMGYVNGVTAAPAKTIPTSATDATPIANPAYEEWEVKDQQVLHFLLSSLSRDILVQVVPAETAREAWISIDDYFQSQSRARVISTRMALSTAQKGSSTVAEYYSKMKNLADEMASAGKKLEDEEFVSYILAGLDIEFNPLVSAVAARVEPISPGELYTQMTSFEQRMDLLHGNGSGSSANSAARGGRGGSNPRGGRNGGNGGRGRGGFGRGRGNGRPGSNGDRPVCQLCGKEGHTVIKCYKRFDHSFTGISEQKSASSASYGIDTNWYMDSGATDNITGDLEKLTVRDEYSGSDQIHTASGAGNEKGSASRAM